MNNFHRLPRVFFLDQSGEIGGAELSLFDIVKHYKGAKTVCLLSSGPFQERLADAGIPNVIISLETSIRRDDGVFSSIKSLPRILFVMFLLGRATRGYDLIYANTMKALVVAVLSRPFHRIPVIWHIRDLLIKEHFSYLMLKVARIAANFGVEHVIANSRATANAFIKCGGKLTPTLIYNAISPEKYLPEKRQTYRRALIEETGLDPNRPIVGVFGRLAKWKGQHIVLEAMSKLPSCQVVFVGSPLFGEESYEEEQKLRGKTSDLSDRVRFLGFRSDIPALMGGVDIVIHSSIQPEPFGRVIVEAMLSGTLVVATKAGGAVEILRDKETGYLVTPGDVEELVLVLKKIMENYKSTLTISKAARADAIIRFSPSNCYPKIEDVINAVMKV